MNDLKPKHFLLHLENKVATITLNRPERKNPLTFESYAELRDTFHTFVSTAHVRVVIITGAGENFCSGGDVNEIIGPLTRMEVPELLRFTRMTGDLIKAIRKCPQVVISAIDGACVGAGAAVAMASDLRIGTARSKVGFLFTRVGLAGCDMGACAMLPRIVGHGRATELLMSGRVMPGEEALAYGFYNRLSAPDKLQAETQALALEYANGPAFAYSMTKTMLDREWDMSLDSAIEAEAQAQAICMKTKDFDRAYQAFVKKEKPTFKGD